VKREFRLRKTKDIQRLRSEGKAFSNRYLVLLVREQPGDGDFSQEVSPTRVGVITGKRIGNAVTRNKVKRRIQAVITQLYAALPTQYDFLLLARKPIVGASYQEIELAVISLLQRAKFLDGNYVQP